MPTWEEVYSPTIETGASFDKFQANYVPVSEIIDELAEQSNYWWKIDKNKILHFLPKDYNDVGYTLNRQAIIGQPEVKNGNPLYRNIQYVKGGLNTTNEITETQKGDGEKKSFSVGYNINQEPTIEIDTGSGFSEETIGLKGREENKDWYWERGDNTLTQDDSGAILSDTDRIRATYIGQYPSITLQRDNDAIVSQQALEGGTTGQVEDAVVQDIEGRDDALNFAQRKLNKYAQESTTISWRTRYTDHESGDLITVNLPELNLDNEKLLITNVTIDDNGGQVFWNVEAVRGPRHKTWSEFFGELKRRAERELRIGISAEDVLVIPFEYEKTWTDADKPNIFRLIYPETGPTWNEAFDTNSSWDNYDTERWSEGRFSLFPANDLYPSYETEDRVKYIAFTQSGTEVFHKAISNQTPPGEPPITSEVYVGPEEFTGTINEIKWYGGFRATAETGTGVEIDSITFNDSKTELEAYQITRTDIKDGDY